MDKLNEIHLSVELLNGRFREQTHTHMCMVVVNSEVIQLI